MNEFVWRLMSFKLSWIARKGNFENRKRGFARFVV